jgi:hypothetical protein
MSNSDTVFKAEGNFTLPAYNVHGAEQTAPAAATVLVDSGQLNPGWYRALVSFCTTDTIANILQIAHRNAANNADLELADAACGVLAGQVLGGGWAEAIFNVTAVNERIVVRNKIVGTAALFYQANIALYLIN